VPYTNHENFLGLSEVSEGDILIYKNGFWINSAVTFGNGHTSGTSGSSGINGTSGSSGSSGSSGTNGSSGLSGTDGSSGSSGTDGSSGSSGVSITGLTLSQLYDVNVLSGLTDNQILVYSGGTWYNKDNNAIFAYTGSTDYQILMWSGNTWVVSDKLIQPNSLTFIPSTGILEYETSEMVNMKLPFLEIHLG
jgi:hypothetical protein